MENVKVTYLGPTDQFQNYSPRDLALVNSSVITSVFGTNTDYIEYFIKDDSGLVLDANYYVTRYGIGSQINPENGSTTQLDLDPAADAELLGYYRGSINVKYNFLRTHLASAPDPANHFWIKEISPSRTEIKVTRQDLSNVELAQAFTAFNNFLTADPYFPTFYLNFGADILLIGVNAYYIEEDGVPYVVFKLYEPLPVSIAQKSTFWVVTTVADSAEYNVNVQVAGTPTVELNQLRGPNYKVSVTDRIGQTTPYYDYKTLLQTILSSSFQQIDSLANERAIQINVDYGNFENFIHFSSATQRLYNFTYKLQQIESASYGLLQTNTTQARVTLQKQIDETINNFDPWEYYLYFASGSASWPKATDRTPYILYSVTSSQAVNWLGSPTTDPSPGVMSMYWSSSYYDNQNKDWLVNSVPQYILDDDINAPYFSFLNMIGQHFDNIWLYLKDVTHRYDANNNPFVGISMDQVSDAIESFGVKLYTNTSISDNIYYSLLGINPTGSTLPVTSSVYSTVVFSSSSLYPPVGSAFLSASVFLPPIGNEKINRYVVTMPFIANNLLAVWNAPSSIYGVTIWGGGFLSRGYVSPTLPGRQLEDEIYKRIYHNLPYLLKTRGTERGMRALITAYGVSNKILEPLEFGGYNYLKYPGIQEISQIRIMTGSVQQISSSLLSPWTTLQYYSNDLQKTSISVQAGFSPADSINASITSSGYVTASNQPGYFNIMQLIGAPNLQYSSSYFPLDTVSNTYFTNEYTSRYDVWDFIRIIKYYNNSLFKMLRDWVPARASADTGIVIKSHMLERNKYPRHEPTVSTSSFDADYYLLALSGSDGGSVIDNTNFVAGVPIQYNGTASIALTASLGTVFMSSSNDIQKYTGEFSGSYIDVVTNYFPQEEVSSYIFPWTSSTPGNNGLFLTYSVSPLFENVFTPVRSQRFLDLDFNTTQFAPVNYGLITKSLEDTVLYGNITQSMQPYSQYAFVQDYNHTFRPYIIPRYSGSYLSGQYNTSSAGDISYGGEPVINYNTDKLGLFVQIATSSFFPGRVNAALAYLADVSGGLFELNQNNQSWQDVQNIFVAGTTATIKQFDNRKFSNQTATDGIKAIYNSGYNYSPQLYYATGSDTRLYFEYLGIDVGGSFRGYTSGSSNNTFISGSTGAPNFPVILAPGGGSVRSGSIYNYLNAENPASPDFATGSISPAVWPSYTASIAGQRTFTINLGINVKLPDPQIYGPNSIQYTWKAIKNQTELLGLAQSLNFTSQYSAGGSGTGTLTVTSPTPSLVYYIYGPVGGSTQTLTGPFDVILNGSPAGTINGTLDIGSFGYTLGPFGPTVNGVFAISGTGDITGSVNFIDLVAPSSADALTNYSSAGGGRPINLSGSLLSLNYTTPSVNLIPGDKVEFRLSQEYLTTSDFTASFLEGPSISYLTSQPAAVGTGGYPFTIITGSGTPIFSISDITDETSAITLNSEVSSFLNYQQVPYFLSGSTIISSSLYSRYGDVNYPFNPQLGDAIVMSDISGITQELTVVTASLQGGRLSIIVTPQVLDNWMNNSNLVYTFLLLRKYQDEQNILLTFNKAPGATSYGFLIPDTISSKVTQNINTLQAAVQSQLLNGQSPLPGGI
jgi:hypothetical protein